MLNKSLPTCLQNASGIVICFWILLFSSNISLLKRPKFYQQQKILAAKTKPNHEKTQKTKYFFDQEVRRIAKKCTWRLRLGRVARNDAISNKNVAEFCSPMGAVSANKLFWFYMLVLPTASLCITWYIYCSWFRKFKKPSKSHFSQNLCMYFN